MSESKKTTISKVLDGARRKLLETGTRNRLIHVNRANQRSNSLNVINERADDIYSILRASGKRMRFKAMGQDKAAEEEILLSFAQFETNNDSDRLTDNFIETPLGPEALARRLLGLSASARTAEEEQGLNILYLAIGFLRWRESPSSDVLREAPLILLPVQLVRNERTSAYDLQCRDDDITTNLPIQERLRQDFGIAFPEVDETEGWLPSHYFSLVQDVISAQPGWSIDLDGMQLGFFSFAKLLMHRDLDPSTWPAGAFTENPLLNGILVDGFDENEPLFGPDDKLDEKLDPAEIIQVIDADASQTKVIEEVRHGASLVVQGPPGTGKSQTITNLIAAAAHDGKTVLFVAEKMAALSVVHDRLVKAGLQDICLELHSRTANKKALAQELARTLAASSKAQPRASDPSQLRITRDELNRISNLLHEPLGDSGETPFRAISEIIGMIGNGVPPPVIPLEGLESLDIETRKQAVRAIETFVTALNVAGTPEEHPFRGVMALDLQPTDLSRLESELSAAVNSIDSLFAEVANLVGHLQYKSPDNLSDTSGLCDALRKLDLAPDDAPKYIPILFEQAQEPRMQESVEAGKSWSEAYSQALPKFGASAWSTELSTLRPAIIDGQTSIFSRWFGKYRRASKELATLLSGSLPKSPSDRMALVDELAEVQLRRKRLAADESWLQQVLGTEWRGERTSFAEIARVVQWLKDLRSSTQFASALQIVEALKAVADAEDAAKSLAEKSAKCFIQLSAPLKRLQLDLEGAGIGRDLDTASLAVLRESLVNIAEDTARYTEWATLERSIAVATECGASTIVESVRGHQMEASRAVQEFKYACAEARWNAARSSRKELNRLSQLDRHELVSLFSQLEKSRIDATKHLILSRHFQQMPRGAAGEIGIIRGEIARKKSHKPVRWVMTNAGKMVQRIKPVMLMSPISVAQFLPPDSITFDLLVIDEASQIRPEDALGVIARARQIVVVGDQKQLPPTSFFDRLVDDIDEPDEDEENVQVGASAADMESILSLCEARGVRQRMLEWHYRSRDPSLIRVSNAEFYGHGLVLPPSPLQLDDNYGLKFVRVPGVYARGGNGLGRQGTNRVEAEAVVKAISEHARHWPELSLGAVAFSKAQADMLTEVLELERRRDPVLDAFLREGKSEDVFVKNIENVQGDERDVILITVGYGPQEANGRLSAMTFGPVNGEGGERRLNVLFSRARVRCEVFASFDPGDIDPGRVKRDGPRVLKRFLEFAKTGVIEEHAPLGLEADSPFEEDVAEVIRSLGYLADPQVGSAGFRIDIGVRHPERPGQYLVAVECDGAAYHSALWARERDRLRQGILENLGWYFHRIWSTDWFHHRKREIERLKAALTEARMRTQGGIQVRGANHRDQRAEVGKIAPAETEHDIDHLVLRAPAYVRAKITVKSKVEPHEYPLPKLAELVKVIVGIEGPIHEDEIAKRIATAFDCTRTGNRIVEATRSAIALAIQHDRTLQRQGSFLATRSQFENPPVRDRSSETGNVIKAAYLPVVEILTAAKQVIAESGDMSLEDLIRSVAKLMGFQRVGPELSETIRKSLVS